ncbi:hypothetical protein ABPG77_003386 [Micractinium sp. CCAP 211/92]
MQSAIAAQRVPTACGSSCARRRAAAPAVAPLVPAAACLRGPAQQPVAARQQRHRGRLVVTAAVKVQKGKQILCNKTLKAKEGSAEAVQQLCSDVAAFSQLRMADRRSGVLAFEMSEDDYEPGTFHFMELYASQKALADHAAAPEFRRFVDQVEPHLAGPLGMVLYEYSADGKIGPASMEGEVKGEGGLDDATGTNRFGGGASMKQTSAVVDLTSIKERDDEEKGLWGIKGLNFELPWMKKKEKK